MVWVDVLSFSFSRHFHGSMWSTTWGLTMTTSVSLWRRRWQIHTTCQRFVSRFGSEIGEFLEMFFLLEGNRSVERHGFGTFVKETKKRLKFFQEHWVETSGTWTWTHYENPGRGKNTNKGHFFQVKGPGKHPYAIQRSTGKKSHQQTGDRHQLHRHALGLGGPVFQHL